MRQKILRIANDLAASREVAPLRNISDTRSTINKVQPASASLKDVKISPRGIARGIASASQQSHNRQLRAVVGHPATEDSA